MIGLIAVIIAGSFIYLNTSAGGERILGVALTSARKAIRGDLEASQLRLSGNRLLLRGAKLFDPDGGLVAEIEEIDVRLGLLSLLRRTLDIQSLRITAPRLTLRSDERGLNLARAIAPREPSAPKAEHPSESHFGFLLENLDLTRGALVFEQVTQQEKRTIELDGLSLQGSGGYASPSGSLAAEMELTGQLRRPKEGPLTAKFAARGKEQVRTAQVALSLAGLRLDAQVNAANEDLRATLSRLELPPELVRAWVPSYPLLVAISASGEVAKHADVAAGKLELKAASARARLEGSMDIRALQSPGVTLRVTGINLRELIARGPDSALEIGVRAQGGGLSLDALAGNLELVLPEGRVRGEPIGPLEVEAHAQRGTVEIAKLVADLPGLRFAGAGQGNQRSVVLSGTLTAANLEALSRTMGGLLRQPPLKISGSGELQLAIKGSLEHPGVSFNGAFPKLRYETYAADRLSVAGTVPDITKPLQSQLTLKATRLALGARVFREPAVNLTTRGRQLEADIRSAGFAQLVLHAGGLLDADHQGLLLNTLRLEYPEEQWSLQRPAQIRFAPDNISTEPLELRSGAQAILVAGSLRKKQVNADVRVDRFDLALLPKAFVPPALRLRGIISADVHAAGRLPQPAVKAQVSLQNGGFKRYGGLELRLAADYQRDRAVGTADARGLGSHLRADFDVPIEALRSRKREPVRVNATLDPTAIERVLEALDRPEAISGTAAANIQMAGTADDPKLQIALEGRGVRRGQTPPADIALTARSGEGGKLAASLEWAIAGSKSSMVVRTPLTVGGLMRNPPTPQSLRSTAMELDLDVHELPLELLRDTGLVRRRLRGAASLRGEFRGSVKQPNGKIVLSLMGVAVGRAPPFDGSLVATASPNGLEATANAQRGGRRLLDLIASLRAPPGELQGVESVVSRPLSIKATLGPLAIQEVRDLLPPSGPGGPRIPPPSGTGQPSPAATAFDGVLRADLSVTGSLAAPTADLRCELDELSAQNAKGKGHLEYTYRQASSSLAIQLASAGGTLNVAGKTQLDLSYPAIRAGLDLKNAPVDVTLRAARFDLGALTGVTSTLRALGGTLDADALVQGSIGTPHVSGRLEWKEGILGVAGYGDYTGIHLLLDGDEQAVHLREFVAHSGRGQAKVAADGHRSGSNVSLTGDINLDKFPLISDDQLVATLSVNSKLQGEMAPQLIDIRRLEIREAHVDLPTEKRKNLQRLSLPDDIVLLRDGKPINEKRYKKATNAIAGLGGSGDLEAEDSSPPANTRQIVMTVDAPRNVWIKGNDLNIEIGLSDGFRVEYAQAPVVFGEVKLLQGRADVLGRRFDVQKNSTVRLSGPPDNPALDVTALYNNEREQVKVFVTLHGQGKNMAITTSSEPPLTETEIYTLIATGHRTLRNNSGASTSGSQLAVSALGSLAATQLKNALAAKLPLDVLSIEAGEGGLTGTKLEAGTYVTDRIYIGYTARINARPELGQNANEVRLDYQISPRWYLEATYGDAKAGGADVIWNRDY